MASRRPKYRAARLLLGLATIVGAIAIVAGVGILTGGSAAGGIMPIAAGSALLLNGLLAVAGAQLGSAALDTAISTRETADAVAELLARKHVNLSDVHPSTGLRASR